MKITWNGNPVELYGTPLQPGDPLPDFTLHDNQLNPVHRERFDGTCVLIVVPSLDTGVCDLEVKNFNKKAASFPHTRIYAVSADLPFAQARWCGSNGIDAVQTLSDYFDHSFGKATGTLVPAFSLLARAVFLVDQYGIIQYAEYVPEVTSHPDYNAIYQVLETCTAN